MERDQCLWRCLHNHTTADTLQSPASHGYLLRAVYAQDGQDAPTPLLVEDFKKNSKRVKVLFKESNTFHAG